MQIAIPSTLLQKNEKILFAGKLHYLLPIKALGNKEKQSNLTLVLYTHDSHSSTQLCVFRTPRDSELSRDIQPTPQTRRCPQEA